MKNLILFAALSLVTGAFAAQNYETLVKSAETSGEGLAPISSIWQKDHADELAAATTPEKIAACVACPCRAKALLAQVKPAYATDPLVAFQIAEVTHFVMEGADVAWYAFWRSSRSTERTVWTEALIDRARTCGDDYVTIFCLDQLRWCAFPDQAEEIRALGCGRVRGVADFAAQVADDLKRR